MPIVKIPRNNNLNCAVTICSHCLSEVEVDPDEWEHGDLQDPIRGVVLEGVDYIYCPQCQDNVIISGRDDLYIRLNLQDL